MMADRQTERQMTGWQMVNEEEADTFEIVATKS